MKLWLCLVAALLFTSPAWSSNDTVSGLIRIDKASHQKFILPAKNAKPMLLRVAYASMRDDLNRLQQGDFLLGRGQVQDDGKAVMMTSFELVGLKQLLGLWRSENWHIYNFENFESMTFYDPVFQHKKAQQMNYLISPGSGDTWSIFMENDSFSYVGDFVFRGRYLLMKIFGNNGEVSHNVKLERLANP